MDRHAYGLIAHPARRQSPCQETPRTKKHPEHPRSPSGRIKETALQPPALAAADAGIRFASEVFADRGYMDDGSLVPRTQPGAMITDEDEAVSRVIKMIKTGFVTGVSGKEIPVRADSVCVHGDGAKALSFTRKIRAALEAEGIAIRPLGEIIG